MADFVFTIDSDDDTLGESSKQAQSRNDDLDPEFSFDPNPDVEVVGHDEIQGGEAIKNVCLFYGQY